MADQDNVLVETSAFVARRRCYLRNGLKGKIESRLGKEAGGIEREGETSRA